MANGAWPCKTARESPSLSNLMIDVLDRELGGGATLQQLD
jgi:hypothetical protein